MHKRFLLLLFSFMNFHDGFSCNLYDTLYKETAVILETPTGKIYGTLTTPLEFTKIPVVIFISGSGPTDRDGNTPLIKGKNNCFLQMAHELANSEIASLRFDKRGIAASKNAMTKEEDLNFDDLVNDVRGWIMLLKNEKRFSSIIIAGHSEGSLIGMIAANGIADKYISLSGAGFPADEIIKHQLEGQTQEIKEACFPIIDSLARGFLVKKVSPLLFSLFRPSVQPYLISWFKHNPQAEIAKLKIPVMIIQGDNDIQVSIQDAQELVKAKPDAKLVIIKDMNHVLKIAPNDPNENIKSYGKPELPIANELMSSIISFIKKGFK